MEEIIYKYCSRCKKSKEVDEFTEPRKLCNKCIEDKKEYYRCKRDGIERVEEVVEDTTPYKMKMYDCPLCRYSVKLYKKSQHEKSQGHQQKLMKQNETT